MALSQVERAQRRTQMARLVAKGSSMQEVSRAFDVTLATVKIACKENGVLCNEEYAPPKSYSIIAMLLNTKKTFQEIGLALDVSETRVRAVYQQCRKVKIRVAGQVQRKHTGQVKVRKKRGRPAKS